MANADVLRLVTNAQIRLPGATSQTVQQELFMVADEFFKESNAWREDIQFDVPGTDPNGTVYEVTPSGNVIIDKLMWMRNADGGGRIFGQMSVPGEITLSTYPSSPAKYIATVALTVTDPTQRDGYVSFPDWVLAKYRGVFLNGILGKMMSQPAKPYTNTQLSVYYIKLFTSGKAAARVDAQRANVYKAQAWNFPSFGGRSQRRIGSGFPPQ